jgi:signal transduction histidine kinase
VSLRLRLGLAITALVLTLVLGAWAVGAGAVLRPLHKQIQADLMTQSSGIADAVEEGDSLVYLRQTHGVDIDLRHRPPPRDHGWRKVDADRETLVTRRGRKSGIAIETDRGWVVIHQKLDLERPGRVLPAMLLIIGVAVGGLALWAGLAAVKPMESATEAMGRIARGDLSHRLTPEGPPELKQVATSFNAMADRIDGMLRTEKEMMAGLSHDLRTPLTRLRLEVELLKDAGVPERRVSAMEGDLAEIEGLIAAMLELSRLELGHHEVRRQPMDLVALAKEAGRGEVPVTGQGRAQVDDALVLRALRNLLDNANAYGTSPEIHVEGNTLHVLDSGPGVPPDQLSRLFDPFFRGDRSRSTKGHGLGLMIVTQVARLHGGEVVASNRPEGGLRVSLRLGELPPPA